MVRHFKTILLSSTPSASPHFLPLKDNSYLFLLDRKYFVLYRDT